MCVCVCVCVTSVCVHVCVTYVTLLHVYCLLGSFPMFLDVAVYAFSLTVTATDVFGTIATVTLIPQAARE